jgi:hypothetical protein
VTRPQGVHCDIGSSELPVANALPQEAVMKLGETVKGMVDSGALSGEDGGWLTATLEEALTAFVKGDRDSAQKSLHHFIEQATALMEAGLLKADQGQELVEAAQMIIEVL